MKKNRGEIALAVTIGIAVGALLLGTLAPNLNPFNNLFGSKKSLTENTQYKDWLRHSRTTTPMVALPKDGQPVVFNKVEESFDTGTDRVTPKRTIGQVVGDFFAGLTTWGVIFLVVSLVFFGGAPIVWLWRKYADMKESMKRVVAGIRDADEDAYKKVTNEIAKKADTKHKKLIDKVKSELN